MDSLTAIAARLNAFIGGTPHDDRRLDAGAQ